MNLPNKLTLLRIVMILPFLLVLYLDIPGAAYVALAIFILASLTDLLDGKIARKYSLITDFGKFADPLADKMLVTAAMLWFVENGQMPGWALLIVIVREFAVSGLRMVASDKGRVIAAGWSGKVKTAATMVCVVIMFLPIPPWLNTACVGVIVVTTIYSGLEYFMKNRDCLKGNHRERKERTMQQLKDRIRREGKVLPGNIIKVDGFLNHRVDTRLMADIADEFARFFDVADITMVLTAEASGIALATICAQKYNVPMVFAKKAKSDNIEGGLYQSEIFSYTYKKKVTQLLSKEWLTSSDRVLIVDDFMANGEAVRGLCDLVSQAGAELVGIGIAVEKGFQGGGDRLRSMGLNYHALAIIESADENGIVFREDDAV